MEKIKFLLVLSLIISSISFSQEIGKIISLNEAEEIFGKVLEEQSISVDVLKNVLNNTIKCVMFNINNSDLTILGDNRMLLYSTNTFIENNDVFHLFSKSKCEELLRLGENKICLFQKREKAFTIENGQYILEYSIPCPPKCN